MAGVVTENARNIATNARNIATNAQNIATNATDIDTLKKDVETVAGVATENARSITDIIARLEKLENPDNNPPDGGDNSGTETGGGTE